MKNQKGITMSDVTITTVILLVFTATIASFSFNAYFSNLKAQRTGMAAIYLSQQAENIGITDYSNIPVGQQTTVIVAEVDKVASTGYTIVKNVQEMKLSESQKGVKTVTITIKYNVGKKQYEHTITRTKVEE